MRIKSGPWKPFRGRLSTFVILACLAWPSPTEAQPSAADQPQAKIESLRNQVDSRRGPAETWAAAILHEELAGGHRVRTGPASRAGILYADQTLQRLNENSELEIIPPTPEKPGFLRLLFGKHYFSSRRPQELKRIETPTVVASIRGTEFVVEVAEDTTTTITLLEGVVEASNPHGSVTVSTGEQAYVEPGKAPVKRIVVRPRDAVVWALYYPAVLGGSDAQRLESLGADGRDLATAAALLSAGQVDQATPLIDTVLRRLGPEPIALALSSVVHVAADRKEEALRLAREASTADPRSPAAALALSFAAQAVFDIPLSRKQAELAAELDPENSMALARAAELYMAEGDLRRAEAMAGKAVENDPGASRALSVLGFVHLAKYRTAEAGTWFQRAVAADAESAIARLGSGLARIRSGDVDRGREEIQIATALDPNNSLLRSYLGKVYYEQRRSGDAGKELALARELDPNDPTPYLYDALRKQNQNRPVEALADLQRSIARNDNRAVYRSRMLLDEDRAVRGADLARIYNDLGFDRLGIVTARRGADEDPSNAASHHLLAGTYRNVPGFAYAFFSELLQARIYQPTGTNAVRPDAISESVSFNEYTALFDRPRARVFASATYGQTDTVDRFPPSVRLADSEIRAGNLVATMNGDRYAAAIGYSRTDSDGYRINNDATADNYRAFFQASPTYRDSLQFSVLVGRQETGDLPPRLFLGSPSPERFDTDLRNIGVGYHRILRPGSDLAVSLIHNKTRQTVIGGGSATLEGPQLEVQQVLKLRRTRWVLGAGRFQGEVRLSSGTAPDLVADDEFSNAYAYLHLQPWRRVDLTLAAAAERSVVPVGLLTPRDARYGPAPIVSVETRLRPKIGVSWNPWLKTTLRAAAFYRLNPAIGRLQTLEPTQLAGFNQFFLDPGGTRSLTYGLGLDQELTPRLFAGASFFRRELTIPEAFCDNPDAFFFDCLAKPVTTVIERTSKDRHRTFYFNAALLKSLTLAVDYTYEKREFDFFRVDNQAYFVDAVRTHRARPQLRFFMRNGFFATAAGNYFDQRIEEFDFFSPLFRTRRELDADFWTLDLEVGYRLPRRFGTLVLRGRNVTGREILFFDQSADESVAPARVISFNVVFTL